MAKIIENPNGRRRVIRLSAYDVVQIVRSYQYLIKPNQSYEEVINMIEREGMYIPEDV